MKKKHLAEKGQPQSWKGWKIWPCWVRPCTAHSTDSNYYLHVKDFPVQENMYDCGIFSLKVHATEYSTDMNMTL